MAFSWPKSFYSPAYDLKRQHPTITTKRVRNRVKILRLGFARSIKPYWAE